MKMRYLTIMAVVFSILVSLSSSPAKASQFSGEYLLKVCAVDRDGAEIVRGGKVACQSYIAGVIDYHNMLKSMDLTSDMNFCIPNDIGLNELQLRILIYLKERQSLHRKFVASSGVAMALFALYPCS